MKHVIVLIVVLFIAFFFLSFKITQIPPGINGDESGIGYNAILISKDLTDENNNFLPLFIFAKGSDWKQPVTVYTTALVFKIFGVSYFNLRATSVLFVLLSLVFLFFISKAQWGFKFFLVSSGLLLTTPIILIQSHLALENIAPLPFIFFWLYMLFRQKKVKNNLNLFLAGASLGIGLFSYLGMRLAIPILGVMTVLYLKNSYRSVFSFLAGILPFFGLLLLAYFRYPGAVLGNYNSSLPSVYEFLFRYLSVFDISFLFFKGDSTAYHSTGIFGMLLLTTLPLFLYGAWNLLQKKEQFGYFILAGFFLSPILFGLVPDIYRASRLLVIIPFYTIISAIGYLKLNNKIAVVMLIVIALNYASFIGDYWFNYSERVKKIFPVTIDQTYEFQLKK